jgi:hypothetical protein
MYNACGSSGWNVARAGAPAAGAGAGGSAGKLCHSPGTAGASTPRNVQPRPARGAALVRVTAAPGGPDWRGATVDGAVDAARVRCGPAVAFTTRPAWCPSACGIVGVGASWAGACTASGGCVAGLCGRGGRRAWPGAASVGRCARGAWDAEAGGGVWLEPPCANCANACIACSDVRPCASGGVGVVARAGVPTPGTCASAGGGARWAAGCAGRGGVDCSAGPTCASAGGGACWAASCAGRGGVGGSVGPACASARGGACWSPGCTGCCGVGGSVGPACAPARDGACWSPGCKGCGGVGGSAGPACASAGGGACWALGCTGRGGGGGSGGSGRSPTAAASTAGALRSGGARGASGCITLGPERGAGCGGGGSEGRFAWGSVGPAAPGVPASGT